MRRLVLGIAERANRALRRALRRGTRGTRGTRGSKGFNHKRGSQVQLRTGTGAGLVCNKINFRRISELWTKTIQKESSKIPPGNPICGAGLLAWPWSPAVAAWQTPSSLMCWSWICWVCAWCFLILPKFYGPSKAATTVTKRAPVTQALPMRPKCYPCEPGPKRAPGCPQRGSRPGTNRSSYKAVDRK